MKKKLLLLVLSLLMMCLLTGCLPPEIYCSKTYGLPKEAKICLLVKSDRGTVNSDLKNTEIGNYSEDGWHCISNITSNSDNVRRYKSVKVAVYDNNGKILKISPEFELRIKGKCYYWETLSYNYKTNEVSGLKTAYYGSEYDNEFTNLLIAFFDVLCFIIYMAAVCRMKEKNYKDYYLYLFLNIPNLIIIIMGGLWTFCGYFQAPDGASNFDRNINGYLFFIGFVCLVNSFGVIRYRRLKRAAAENEREE